MLNTMGNHIGSQQLGMYGVGRKVYDELWGSSISYGEYHQNVYNIYIGDYVRFNAGNYDHSIVVTNIVGDLLYYTDCNAKLDGRIQWDRSMTKVELQEKVSKKLNFVTSDRSYGHIVHCTGNNITSFGSLSVTINDNCALFTWGKSESATSYAFKIFKGKLWESAAYFEKYNLTGTEYYLALEPGEYQAFIDICENGEYVDNGWS